MNDHGPVTMENKSLVEVILSHDGRVTDKVGPALVEQLSMAPDDRQALIASLVEKDAAVAQVLTELSRAQEDCRMLRASLATQETNMNNMLVQMNRVADENREIRAKLEDKETKLAKLRSWLGETGRMLSKSDQKMEELSSRLGQTKDDLEQARTKTRNLSKDLSESRALLRATYESTSWRVTAPLRRIGSYYRGTRTRQPRGY